MRNAFRKNASGVLGLTLALIAAKLFGYIDWSWWIVTSPTWVALIICGIVLGMVMIIEFW